LSGARLGSPGRLGGLGSRGGLGSSGDPGTADTQGNTAAELRCRSLQWLGIAGPSILIGGLDEPIHAKGEKLLCLP
jgi:hypothetical protein